MSHVTTTLAFLLLATGCGAAQMAGVSMNGEREFEIDNKSKTAVCSLDVVNAKNVVTGADTANTKVDVKPGEKKTVKVTVAVDQERIVRAKACDGKVLKEQTFPYAKDKATLVVE